MKKYFPVFVFIDPSTLDIHRLIGHLVDSYDEAVAQVEPTLEEWRDGCTLPRNYEFQGMFVMPQEK